jgi:hypothetical protein
MESTVSFADRNAVALARVVTSSRLLLALEKNQGTHAFSFVQRHTQNEHDG